MADYKAPLRDMRFVLNEVFEVSRLWAQLPALAEVVDAETAAAILGLVDGRRDVAAIIAMLNERFPEAGGVDDDVIEFLQIACQQKWITCREPE